MVETVAKSLAQSYGIDLNKEGLAAFWPLTRSSVWPSGAARATDPAALIPPAPGMFSITTGLPNESDIFCATARGDVPEAARTEADNDLDRPRRIILGIRRREEADGD
jgi:hypothetical protein